MRRTCECLFPNKMDWSRCRPWCNLEVAWREGVVIAHQLKDLVILFLVEKLKVTQELRCSVDAGKWVRYA